MTTGLSLLDPLRLHSYDLVVVHPPWPYETWSPRGPALSSHMSSRYAGSGVFCWSTSSALGLNAGEIAPPMVPTDAMISTETKKA